MPWGKKSNVIIWIKIQLKFDFDMIMFNACAQVYLIAKVYYETLIGFCICCLLPLNWIMVLTWVQLDFSGYLLPHVIACKYFEINYHWIVSWWHPFKPQKAWFDSRRLIGQTWTLGSAGSHSIIWANSSPYCTIISN